MIRLAEEQERDRQEQALFQAQVAEQREREFMEKEEERREMERLAEKERML